MTQENKTIKEQVEADLEFMSKVELAPIDRVNYMKNRIEDEKQLTRKECEEKKMDDIEKAIITSEIGETIVEQARADERNKTAKEKFEKIEKLVNETLSEITFGHDNLELKRTVEERLIENLKREFLKEVRK